MCCSTANTSTPCPRLVINARSNRVHRDGRRREQLTFLVHLGTHCDAPRAPAAAATRARPRVPTQPLFVHLRSSSPPDLLATIRDITPISDSVQDLLACMDLAHTGRHGTSVFLCDEMRFFSLGPHSASATAFSHYHSHLASSAASALPGETFVVTASSIAPSTYCGALLCESRVNPATLRVGEERLAMLVAALVDAMG